MVQGRNSRQDIVLLGEVSSLLFQGSCLFDRKGANGTRNDCQWYMELATIRNGWNGPGKNQEVSLFIRVNKAPIV
jgi:hypothetical protein